MLERSRKSRIARGTVATFGLVRHGAIIISRADGKLAPSMIKTFNGLSFLDHFETFEIACKGINDKQVIQTIY